MTLTLFLVVVSMIILPSNKGRVYFVYDSNSFSSRQSITAFFLALVILLEIQVALQVRQILRLFLPQSSGLLPWIQFFTYINPWCSTSSTTSDHSTAFLSHVSGSWTFKGLLPLGGPGVREAQNNPIQLLGFEMIFQKPLDI